MPRSKCLLLSGLIVIGITIPLHSALSEDQSEYWLKVEAKTKAQRNLIANSGASIEVVRDNFVMVSANLAEKTRLEKLGLVEVMNAQDIMDFPQEDRDFHTYEQTTAEMQALQKANPDLMRMVSIGKSVEGRDLWMMIISKDVDHSQNKPAALYLGGHHAREHLSVEIPLRFMTYLMDGYKNGDARAIKYVEGRQIHVIPMVNPDGLEYDTEGGAYKAWRKNKSKNADGTFGTDLNRNYGYFWGTGGSSQDPSDETYMGTSAFSEPETQAVKKYIEAHTNISVLLTFHTFSELILYPWGHSEQGIPDARDKAVHETMARKMATWNQYTPEQSSALYVASGDLTDWAYGEHKIISFTFELDPTNSGLGVGGFYPGQAVIGPVLQKNIEPCLYLLEYADNPYRVLDPAERF